MKKILLLLLMMSSATFAADIVFYVENPEMVSAYYNIFLAIVQIFNEGDATHPNQFVNLLRLMFLVGGFFVFAAGIFNSMGKGGEGALGGYIKYLLVGVALLTLVFYKHPDTKVWIISKTTASYCEPTQGLTGPDPQGLLVPGEFPTLLAYAFWFTNKIGIVMTEVAETAYTTAGMVDLEPQKMSTAGYMGALKASMSLIAIDPNKISLSNTDPATGADRQPYDMGKAYRAMFTDCVLIPFSAKGIEGAEAIAELKGTSDIHGYLNAKFSATGSEANDSIGGILPRDYSMTYQGEVYNCGDFYDKVIDPIHTKFYGDTLCGIPVGTGAISLLVGDTNITNPSEFQQVAVQAGLVSELEGSLTSLGVGVSGVGYASGKTRAEFIQSSLSSGVYMAEMLPYLQMTIRAILYGFFPFVFVMVLLPGGLKVLGTFFQTIIWVELWSPTAAIINMFMMSHATNEFQNIYGGSGLTMMSSVDMLSTGSTIAGIAGYLYLSVPALTWLIMKGSAQMLGSITGAMGAGMARNITTQAINEDKALVAKAGEASARSGKDIGMAEMQHYEAIQGGRMEGAKLGAQMNAGMNTMADMAEFDETKKTAGFNFLSDATGGSAAGMATALAAYDSVDNTAKVHTGNAIQGPKGLNNDTQNTARKKSDQQRGEFLAIGENGPTINEAKNAKKFQQQSEKGKGDAYSAVGGGAVRNASDKSAQWDAGYWGKRDVSLSGLNATNANYGDTLQGKVINERSENGVTQDDLADNQVTGERQKKGATKAIHKEPTSAEDLGFQQEETNIYGIKSKNQTMHQDIEKGLTSDRAADAQHTRNMNAYGQAITMAGRTMSPLAQGILQENNKYLSTISGANAISKKREMVPNGTVEEVAEMDGTNTANQALTTKANNQAIIDVVKKANPNMTDKQALEYGIKNMGAQRATLVTDYNGNEYAKTNFYYGKDNKIHVADRSIQQKNRLTVDNWVAEGGKALMSSAMTQGLGINETSAKEITARITGASKEVSDLGRRMKTGKGTAAIALGGVVLAAVATYKNSHPNEKLSTKDISRIADEGMTKFLKLTPQEQTEQLNSKEVAKQMSTLKSNLDSTKPLKAK